ncbi:MAG: hypothetical protein NT133_21445, partial [Alphaproteobacteria bacterium]|nr:hypothetical protein [Alphaproteobacteria bacterium]
GGRPGPIFAQAAGGPGINVFDQLHAQAERWSREGRGLVVAAWTRGSRERLANLLREHGFAPAMAESWHEAQAHAVSLVILGLERGFVADLGHPADEVGVGHPGVRGGEQAVQAVGRHTRHDPP